MTAAKIIFILIGFIGNPCGGNQTIQMNAYTSKSMCEANLAVAQKKYPDATFMCRTPDTNKKWVAQ